MIQYLTIFEKGVPVTEDKTIIEELAGRSPEQKAEDRRIERAYHLVSQGYWSEADALFDEILKTEPDNHEALMGKKLIARTSNVTQRMDNLGARAYKASAREKSNKRFKSKTVLWIAIVLALLCAGIAIAVVTDALPVDLFTGDEPAPTPTPTVEVTPTPEPTQSAEDFLREHLFDTGDTN